MQMTQSSSPVMRCRPTSEKYVASRSSRAASRMTSARFAGAATNAHSAVVRRNARAVASVETVDRNQESK